MTKYPMTNECRNPNSERSGRLYAFRRVVRSSIGIRHSSFVIAPRCGTARAALLALGLATTVVQAEKMEDLRLSIPQVLAQQPLAECAVQSLGGESPPEAMRANAVMLSANMTSDPLDNYARTRDGEWQIPAPSTDDDPWVRLLILPPHQPLIVDVAVIEDGRSYRLAREKWVNLLLSQAKGKYSPNEKSEENTDKKPDEKTADAESALAEGTSADSTASEEESAESAEEPSDKKDEEEAEQSKGVQAQSRKEPTVIQRLKNYVAAVDDQADPLEIRWLLADWTGGPELIVLGPAASWQRAEVAPLWSWLDADGDHGLSSAEIAEAFDRLQQADVDEDDIVDLAELFRNDHPASPYQKQFAHPLVVVIDDDTDWNSLLDDLADVYGEPYSSKSAMDLAALKTQAPDLVCRVSLDAKDAKLAMLSVDPALGDATQSVDATDSVITVDVAGSYIELSAASAPAGGNLEVTAPQIALGAVVDGYPLFRLLDADGDQRITRPEQRQLADLLRELDHDGDGQIGPAEIPTAIRLAVTSGPHVHELLRERTRAARLRSRERLPVPGWFTDMDRNRDGELSRREFLGTSTQFDQLDRDGNDLIIDKEVQDSAPAGEPP